MTTRTFSEAIISEYYQLKGYFVETGVILKSSHGRDEVDLIAVKYNPKKEYYEVVQIEVGQLVKNYKNNLKILKNKFRDDKIASLKNYVKERLGDIEINFTYRYLATYVSKKSYNYIRENTFPIWRFEDVIKNEIFPEIFEWKKNNKILLCIPRFQIISGLFRL